MKFLLNASKALRIPCKNGLGHTFTRTGTTETSAPPSNTTISIPRRIPRGPTDLLKVLEKTVSYDMTGPHYKFHDDPYLTPFSGRTERLYLFAKESGRKAARWVRDQHPELFTQVIAEPQIQSYMVPVPINEVTASEEMLLEKINNTLVSDAIKVYEVMKSVNVELSRESRQKLLELLCFYNATDPIPMEDPTERFFNCKENPHKPEPANVWKSHPLVKSLFASLEPQDSAAYSALICGLYTYGARKEGDEVVVEAKQKGITLDVHAYNAYLLRIITLYETNDVKHEMTMEVLQDMNRSRVKPNLGTLNACLNVVGRINRPGKMKNLSQIIKEFQTQGINPSPGTFALFIQSCNISQPNETLDNKIKIILEAFKGKALEGRHLTDIMFFNIVMSACYESQNVENAIKCFEIAHLFRNHQLLGGGRKRLQFYNQFLLLISQKCPLETLVKYYKLLVPNVYTPDPRFYMVLFDICDQNGSVELLADFWEDFYASGGSNQETVMKILEVSCNLSGFPLQAAYDARPKLGALAKRFWTVLTENENAMSFSRYQLTPELCNYMLILLARACEWRTIQSVLANQKRNAYKPDLDVLKKVIASCIENNNPDVGVWIAKFCMKNFQCDNSIASDLLEGNFLNDHEKKEIGEFLSSSQYDSSTSSSSSSESESDSESSDSDDISVPRKEKSKEKILK